MIRTDRISDHYNLIVCEGILRFFFKKQFQTQMVRELSANEFFLIYASLSSLRGVFDHYSRLNGIFILFNIPAVPWMPLLKALHNDDDV